MHFRLKSKGDESKEVIKSNPTSWTLFKHPSKSAEVSPTKLEQKNVNVLSMQNANFSLSLGDILGISHLAALQTTILSSFPQRVRWLIVVWELVVVSAIVFVWVRWMMMGERAVNVGVRVLEDGIDILEWMGRSLKSSVQSLWPQ
jgi:hypothetical protein